MTLPSRLQLPPGHWRSLLDGLCARFPRIDRAQWQDRFARGRVQDPQGRALAPDMPWQVGLEIQYFREVADEPVVPFAETILHLDAHLLVADKPHFLPVTPAGGYVRETLLARLVARTGNTELAPLHRLDRLTAGLVLFSTQAATRDAYQRLFRERRIEKTYEALAPALPGLAFPLQRDSHLVPGEPFFRMAEVPGEPNARSRIELIEAEGPVWRYRLLPETGRKHQLRVHMAALGAPIEGDDLYPLLRPRPDETVESPLQLLAQGLAFDDPLRGSPGGSAAGAACACPARAGRAVQRTGRRANQRSSSAANSCRSRGPSGGGPSVCTPAPRSSSMKLRIDSRSAMLFGVYSWPRGFSATAFFSSTRAANGMSWVTTRSPAATRSTMALSATSRPCGTWIERSQRDGGVRIHWLATRVSSIPTRSAARNRMSRMTVGQASASTQMRGRAGSAWVSASVIYPV